MFFRDVVKGSDDRKFRISEMRVKAGYAGETNLIYPGNFETLI